jgi:uncharacterized repeat protein (TIGR04138 family)
MSHPSAGTRKRGFVSLWVGEFPTRREAEVYFGIPDEIGVYLPAEGFIADTGVADFPPETLEANFEQLARRRLSTLLADATYSASFIDPAIEAAHQLGIAEAQGVALLYDWDYDAIGGAIRGPLTFIGSFPYVATAPGVDLTRFRDLAARLGYPVAAVLLVAVVLDETCNQRQRKLGPEARHLTAQEYCDHLLKCRGEHTRETLLRVGLKRSEDVGRVMFGLIETGTARRRERDTEGDFAGLFDLACTAIRASAR